MARPEVQRGVGHVCRFGIAVPKSARADGSGHQLVRKPTRWMSSLPEILKRARLQCRNEGLPAGDPKLHERA
eukprot:14970129-Alexandrium_andersonii.AAC.1